MQCVGAMRERASEQFEKCKSLKDLHQYCSYDIVSSLKSAKASILVHLELKGKKFQVFESSSDQEIDNFFMKIPFQKRTPRRSLWKLVLLF